MQIGERVAVIPKWNARDAKVDLLDDLPYGVSMRPCATVASSKVRRSFRTESFVQRRPQSCNVVKALHIPVFVPHPSNFRTSESGIASFSDGRARFLLQVEEDDAIAEDKTKRQMIR